MFDVIMTHEEAHAIVRLNGWEGFFKTVEQRFPKHDLYSMSQEWYDDSKYFCKFRGGNGDIIIGWHGVHGTM